MLFYSKELIASSKKKDIDKQIKTELSNNEAICRHIRRTDSMHGNPQKDSFGQDYFETGQIDIYGTAQK